MASYAYGGSAGGPCTDNVVTGEHEHHYGAPGPIGIEFGRPTPVHTLRAHVRDHELAMANLDRRVDAIVAEFGRVGDAVDAQAYDGEVETAGARRLLALARENGFTAQIIVSGDLCTVEGHHPSRVGFRAYWTRGAADGGSWHAPWAYAMIHDERSVEMDAKAHVGKKGHRTTGQGPHRMSIVASPRGVASNVTEISRRIREIGSAS